ncbi:MAG TPA: vWA domain-containing protein [Chitinophagaceae bacterium]|nr:vWA domain-containing protein [Chitinophagaceae bacterium]
MKLLASFFATATIIAFFSFSKPQTSTSVKLKPESRKIQAAILLDVSNSMDGLIEQAKAQLWNMVTTLGKAQCTDKSAPQVEVALYEYGRSSNDAGKGYVKRLSSFTQDLDSVSKILFGLTTNGGDEYCGQVIYTSMDELKWDSSPDNYKVIFISGNEDFLQGNVLYTNACAKAKQKGVIVNTIYCGDRMQGIKEHWNLLNECGNGSFTNINTDAREIEIPTPYDSTLIVLNSKLNGTYIGYGSMGYANSIRQQEVDKMNFKTSNGAGLQRVNAKAMSNAYNNESWDLVDAIHADSTYFSKLDKKTLPDSLKNKSTNELKGIVKQKAEERMAIQQHIQQVNTDRSKFIAAEKAKAAANNIGQTLESVIETIIREQVKRFKMQIPKN